MERSNQTALFRLAALFLVALFASAVLQFDCAVAQTSAPTQLPPKIEPKALSVLRSACDTLSRAQTMGFTAVDTYERANYDGKTISAYVPSTDLIAVADAPPTIDQMLDAAWHVGAIYFPFGDVIASNPCAVFEKLTSAFYVGQSIVVGGTKTDMVAVAGDGVQAELWIGADDHLPRMVRVVYTNEPAHAHYQTEYMDWRLNTPADATAFRSSKVGAAKRISFTPPGAVPRPRTAASTGQMPEKKPRQ